MQKNVINFENKSHKKINRNRLIAISVITIMTVVTVLLVIMYSSNKSVRKFLDKYFFGKIVTEEKLASIQLDYDSNVSVIGYNKYICVLAENTLKQYNISGDLANEIKLEISNPIYHIKNRYLAISEKNGSKIYLLSDSKILWEKEVDGMISKIDVSKNGYVSVIISGTTHKSVIIIYDVKGNELFKTYLASTIAIDATISPDSKYLAFAEINVSGTSIQSNIKVMSITKATESPSNAIIYTYEETENNLITNIEYQDKNKLLCMYDNAIHVIYDNKDEVIMKLQEDNKKISAADIKLNNYIFRTIEKQSGLFQANTMVEIVNIENKKESIYTIEGVAKNIECYDNIIAINLGQEIDFINTNGWLVKNYTSSQDVQAITIANGLAGIVYRDKVEIINL